MLNDCSSMINSHIYFFIYHFKGIVWAPIMSNEEQILSVPANAARCCVLDTKYIGTMDLELEQGDKEFLYEMGRLETLRWMKKRAAEVLSRTASE